MSYLVTENWEGNLHAAAASCNRLGVARNLFMMDYGSNYTVVVFRADDYPDYVRLCEKLKRKPVSTEEFFA